MRCCLPELNARRILFARWRVETVTCCSFIVLFYSSELQFDHFIAISNKERYQFWRCETTSSLLTGTESCSQLLISESALFLAFSAAATLTSFSAIALSNTLRNFFIWLMDRVFMTLASMLSTVMEGGRTSSPGASLSWKTNVFGFNYLLSLPTYLLALLLW